MDENSRHKGKLDTERYLAQSGIPFTAIRPTYIYGPMNYNPLGRTSAIHLYDHVVLDLMLSFI